jgi:transcription initiation factor IIE alpha subunit
MNGILKFLKKHGESLDTDIAEAVGISLAKVHVLLSQLSASGQVVSYHSIRLEDGIKIEGMRYRVTGVLKEAIRVRGKKNPPPNYWHNYKG